MSPYQHIFSANAVLGVWRNLRNNRDQNDVLLTIQYQPDSARGHHDRKHGEAREAIATGGRSIGFVVPWRSMQAQRRELKEKEKELAEALVVLAGEVAFTELPPTLQASLTQNPLVQIRHLAAGLSRQMSKTELQMADNAAFSAGKNLYTGGELAHRFLPTVQTLFYQQPVPRRIIFELLMELKDLVYMGITSCDQQVLRSDIEESAMDALEEMDNALVQAVASFVPPISGEGQEQDRTSGQRRLLRRTTSSLSTRPQTTTLSFLASDVGELLHTLESLETTSYALANAAVPIPDFCAHAIITLRRLAPRRNLAEFSVAKTQRTNHCAEYARCMKWAGASWRQAGGCRKGCKNEDADPINLPSWHRSSRWYDEGGSGTFMVGGGRASRRYEGLVDAAP